MRRLMLLLTVAALVTAAQANVLVYEGFGDAPAADTTLAGYSGTSAETGLSGTWAVSGGDYEYTTTRATWEYVGVDGGYTPETTNGDQHWYEHGDQWWTTTADRSLSNSIDLTVDGTLYISYFTMSGGNDYVGQVGLTDGTNELMFGNGWNRGLTAYYGALDTSPDTNNNSTTVTQSGWQTGFYVIELTKSDSGATDLLDVTIDFWNFGRLDALTNVLDTPDASRTLQLSGVSSVFDGLRLKLDGGGNQWPSIDEVHVGTIWEDVVGFPTTITNDSPANNATLIPVARTESGNDLVFTVIDPNIADVEVYLSENDPNADNLIKTITSVGTGQQTVTLETEWPTDLAFDTPYYWKVIGYEPNAVSGQNDILVPGPIWSFTTAPEAPLITANPAVYTAVDAGEPNIVLTADGINGTFKWYKDGFAIDDGADYAGTTTGTLTIYDVQLADEGYYTMKVTNGPLVAESTAGRVMIHRQTSYYDFESTSVVDGNDVYVDSIGDYQAVLMADSASAGSVTSVTDANTIAGLGAYAYIDNGDDATDPNGQYLQIYPGVSAYDDITISFWAHPLETRPNQRFFSCGSGGEWPLMFLTPDNGSGSMRFALDDGNGRQDVTAGWLEPGAWYYVTVTQGISEAKIYVNGEWRATTTTYKNPRNCQSLLNMIGKSVYPADPYYHGYIDDLKIYNYARTNEQIAQDYMAVTGDSYVCDTENNDVGNYDDVANGGNGNCKIDLPDFAGMAARWLEADQFYPAP